MSTAGGFLTPVVDGGWDRVVSDPAIGDERQLESAVAGGHANC
jgi:hypothetical protein